MPPKQSRQGDEPIPGYRLVDFLGRGGFGEVWKASGPGGIEVALKIIDSLAPRQGGKELRALRLLRKIRHPNLVPLLGYWLKNSAGQILPHDELEGDSGPLAKTPTAAPGIVATQLIVAMGLGEMSLFDRLERCQAEGLPGIPVAELLQYMQDAARAIDLLNAQHNIQHCDIKPQNILILSGAAQVCDFGLAKAIGDLRQTSMTAGTIAYGAPELFQPRGPSSSTDQYSLAISYYELRTGSLPFGEEMIAAVLDAKQTGRLDFSKVTPPEQEVLAKATAVDPAQRFPTTVAMVRRLRACFPDLETFALGAGAPGPLEPSAPTGRGGEVRGPTATGATTGVSSTAQAAVAAAPSGAALPMRGTMSVAGTDTDGGKAPADWRASPKATRARRETAKSARPALLGPLVGLILLGAAAGGIWTQREPLKKWWDSLQIATGPGKPEPPPKPDEPTKIEPKPKEPNGGKSKPSTTIPATDVPDVTGSLATIRDQFRRAGTRLAERADDTIADCSEALAVLDSLGDQAKAPAAARLGYQLHLLRARAYARATPPSWTRVRYDLDQIADQLSASAAGGGGEFKETDSERFSRVGLWLLIDQATAAADRRPAEVIVAETLAFRQLGQPAPSTDWPEADAKERDSYTAAADALEADVLGQLGSLLDQPRRGLDLSTKLLECRPRDLRAVERVVDFQTLAGDWNSARAAAASAEPLAESDAARKTWQTRQQALDHLARLDAGPSDLSQVIGSINAIAPVRSSLTPALQLVFGRVLMQIAEKTAAARDTCYPVLNELLNDLVKSESTSRLASDLNRRYGELRKADRMVVRQRIVQEIERETPPDYAALLAYCQESERKGLADSLVRAAKVECLLKASAGPPTAEDWKKAEAEAKVLAEGSDLEPAYQPYASYVTALVRRADPKGTGLETAADLIAKAYAPVEVAAGLKSHRRDEARKILAVAAAVQRKVAADTAFLDWMRSPYPTPAAAARAYGWLNIAADQKLGPMPRPKDATEAASGVDAQLVAAAWHMTKPDKSVAGNLAVKVVGAFEPSSWPREATPVLYVDMQASLAKPDCLRGAAALLSLAYREAIGDASREPEPVELHGLLIAPVLKTVESQVDGLSDAQRRWLAMVRSYEGRLIRVHAYEKWEFPEPLKRAELAYSQAILNDRQAEYYVGRGFVRLKLARGEVEPLKAVEQDARSALEIDPTLAGAHALMGNVLILQSRHAGNEEKRRDLLKSAVDECTSALNQIEKQDPEYPHFLIDRSAAYLEQANFSFDPTLELQADLLGKARDDAEAASKLRSPYQDWAYRALGNAEEDLAWIAQKSEHWQPAIDAFTQAIDLRRDLPFGHLDRGRCYHKWVQYGGADVGLLDQRALPDLEEAARLSEVTQRPELLAESHYWIAQGHGFQRRYDEADKSCAKALEVLPKFHDVMYYRASVNLKLGRLNEAERWYDEAIRAAREVASLQRFAYLFAWVQLIDPSTGATMSPERRQRIAAAAEACAGELAAEVDLFVGTSLELTATRQAAIDRYTVGLARATAQPQVRAYLALRRAVARVTELRAQQDGYRKTTDPKLAEPKKAALLKYLADNKQAIVDDLEASIAGARDARSIAANLEPELMVRAGFALQGLSEALAPKPIAAADPEWMNRAVKYYEGALKLAANHPTAYQWHYLLVKAWDANEPLSPSKAERFALAVEHLQKAVDGATDKNEKSLIDRYRQNILDRKK